MRDQQVVAIVMRGMNAQMMECQPQMHVLRESLPKQQERLPVMIALQVSLTLHIQMEFSIQINTIRMGFSPTFAHVR